MNGVTNSVSAWRPLRCRGPEAQLFAIGDVHGQAAALAAALDAIAAVPAIGLPRWVLFLGDLIDRGPDSLGAIQLAMGAAARARADELVCLPGNHELMLLDALLDPEDYMSRWLGAGGDELARQVDADYTAGNLTELAELLEASIDSEFLSRMTSGPTFHKAGDVLFVHAGLHPKTDPHLFLARDRFWASDEHWAWIRNTFLDWQGGWGPDQSWMVVHGHTPAVADWSSLSGFIAAADRLLTHHRLCLDAGAAHKLPQIGWGEFGPDKYRIGLTIARS